MNVQPEYRNEIWHRKLCHADNEKWGKRNRGRKRRTKSKTLGEKENYKHLGILEADILKQAKMKGKNKKIGTQTNG